MKKPKKQKSLYATLWKTANKLRGKMDAANYKYIVLSLFFLKIINDKFQEKRKQLIEEGQKQYIDDPCFYDSGSVLWLPEESRWSNIIEKSKEVELCVCIDEAFKILEDAHPKKLKGALSKNYFSQSKLENSRIRSLLNEIEKINSQEDGDLLGKVYQYFLRKFSEAEGKNAGEFYTPETIVKLIVSLIEPFFGKVYDPCCGSGGMFVQSVEFIKQHQGNQEAISIYGQESSETTHKLAKINLAIRGIDADFGEAADTFTNDQHVDLKADYIMANPPFNQEEWDIEGNLKDDPRWQGYEVPPSDNANYAWILHMVNKLSSNGIAAFLLSNGALSSGGKEYEIRKQLIKNDLIETILLLPKNMFSNTDISVTLWIVNKNKKNRTIKIEGRTKELRDRSKEILFMDLRTLGSWLEKNLLFFEQKDIDSISKIYQDWKTIDKESKYQDKHGFCKSVSFAEVEKNDFSLVPSKYVLFDNLEEEINWEEKFQNVSKEITVLFEKEEELKKEVEKILRNFKA